MNKKYLIAMAFGALLVAGSFSGCASKDGAQKEGVSKCGADKKCGAGKCGSK